jgi:hypothetical protein
MLQHMIMIIFIVNGTLRALLIRLATHSARSQGGTFTLICSQQFLANEHSENMCLSVSSFWRIHKSQE